MIPYPVEKEYRIKATQAGTAVNRAIREYRQGIKKGRRIKKYNIQAIKL